MRDEQKIMAWVEALYMEEFPKMVDYAAKRLNDQDQAQELVQETFQVLLERAEELVFHANVHGWLMQTLKNKLLAYWKTGRTNLRRFVAYEEAGALPGTPSPEEALVSLAEDSILDIARKQLPEAYYRHLIRLTVDGATHVAVAKEFGITVSASQKRLERTRSILQRALPNRKKLKIFQKICQLLMLTAIYR